MKTVPRREQAPQSVEFRGVPAPSVNREVPCVPAEVLKRLARIADERVSGLI